MPAAPFAPHNVELPTQLANNELPRNRVTALIERHATTCFILVGLLLAISFNGQWRIGLDSANYRGLADGIATGRGYEFGDWAPKNIYPGLPLMLAGCQRLFGRAATFVPCLCIMLMGAAALVITYRLVRIHYPKWVAVNVTCAVGGSAWFVQQCNELMTDVPFLLGVVLTLYGWELLHIEPIDSGGRTARRSNLVRGALAFGGGLALSASMRPTFWILCAAVVAAAVLQLFGVGARVGSVVRRRRISVAVLVAMVTIVVGMKALDPRSGGISPLSGGYEREFAAMLRDLVHAQSDNPMDSPASLGRRALVMLNDQLPAGVFGEQLSLGALRLGDIRLSPSSILGSLLIIGSCWLVVKRGQVLWALLAWFTVVVTVIASAEPRYYLMAMPVFMLGWLLLIVELSKRLPPGWPREAALAAGIALVALNNFSATVPLIKEQRSVPFQAHYKWDRSKKIAEWVPPIEMARLIREKLPADARVIGPSGSVMSFESGRHVYTQRELLPRRGRVAEFPKILASHGIEYAVFPAPNYRAKEPAIARLMERGVLRQDGPPLAEVRGMRLARLRVVVPESGDWTKLPKIVTGKRPGEKPVARAATARSAAQIEKDKARAYKAYKAAKAQKAAREARLYKKAKEQRLAIRAAERAARAATAPLTPPPLGAAQQPPPTTAPTTTPAAAPAGR